MTERPWYNGYSPRERDTNFAELKRQMASGDVPPAAGPCGLCGDPGGIDGMQFEYHNEDYSFPLCTSAPGLVALCRHCHRNKLHKRFSDAIGWQVFLAHVRRGGYARELKEQAAVQELKAYRTAVERGGASSLRTYRPYQRVIGSEWFAALRMDVESLKSANARPRP